MKNTFPGFYEPDFKSLWDNCFFVFDTNVLVDLYDSKMELLDNFLRFFNVSGIEERLWIPYHVGLEYQHKILEKKINQSNKLGDSISQIEKVSQDIEYNSEDFKENVDNLKSSISFLEPDEKKVKIDTLFNDKIGKPFTVEELSKLKNIGSKRFDLQIPPGYTDYNKNNNEFGDLIIWCQIMKYSKEKQKPIILIQQEKKHDWWLKDSTGKIIAPIPELVQEFKENTKQSFYMYRLQPSFINYAEDHFGVKLENKDRTLENIETVEETRRARQKLAINGISQKIYPRILLTPHPTYRKMSDHKNLEIIQMLYKLEESKILHIIERLNKFYDWEIPTEILIYELMDYIEIDYEIAEVLFNFLLTQGDVMDNNDGTVHKGFA